MIREEDLMREIKALEKEVERMDKPTKTEFMKLIKKMKINLEQPIEFEIPEFLRRI